MIDGRADLARGSVDQAETHVARWVFHAVKISRDAPVGVSSMMPLACAKILLCGSKE